MRLLLSSVVRATLAYYKARHPEMDVNESSLSWLSQEYLDDFCIHVKMKDDDQVECDLERKRQHDAAFSSHAYWGHHHFVDDSTGRRIHFWTNDNASSGLDRADGKCWGDFKWGSTSVGTADSGSGCPNNSPGASTGWWAGDPINFNPPSDATDSISFYGVVSDEPDAITLQQPQTSRTQTLLIPKSATIQIAPYRSGNISCVSIPRNVVVKVVRECPVGELGVEFHNDQTSRDRLRSLSAGSAIETRAEFVDDFRLMQSIWPNNTGIGASRRGDAMIFWGHDAGSVAASLPANAFTSWGIETPFSGNAHISDMAFLGIRGSVLADSGSGPVVQGHPQVASSFKSQVQLLDRFQLSTIPDGNVNITFGATCAVYGRESHFRPTLLLSTGANYAATEFVNHEDSRWGGGRVTGSQNFDGAFLRNQCTSVEMWVQMVMPPNGICQFISFDWQVE